MVWLAAFEEPQWKMSASTLGDVLYPILISLKLYFSSSLMKSGCLDVLVVIIALDRFLLKCLKRVGKKNNNTLK